MTNQTETPIDRHRSLRAWGQKTELEARMGKSSTLVKYGEEGSSGVCVISGCLRRSKSMYSIMYMYMYMYNR